MKVFYKKDTHIIIHFPADELKQALAVLKALAQYFGAKFLFQVAGELEKDLNETPRLVYKSEFHICEKCFMELHEKDENSVRVNDSWKHHKCPQLKPDSQRER
jgi:regulator of replication initiation timing